jgi:RimJ/RimL family protein N-acetyltransferase
MFQHGSCAAPKLKHVLCVWFRRANKFHNLLSRCPTVSHYRVVEFSEAFVRCHVSHFMIQLSRPLRHLMPIVTPRLVLRPTLDDLDSIQTAKEEAWPDLRRWMTWAFDNQRSRQAMEDSIRRGMDYQNQAGIQLAGFHRVNGDFVVRTALDITEEPGVYETGYWVAPKYAGQGMATEATNGAIRYAFGHLGAKAISIGYYDGNEPSRHMVEKLGFKNVRVAHNAATRCLDGMKLDRHEYILTSPDALPEPMFHGVEDIPAWIQQTYRHMPSAKN